MIGRTVSHYKILERLGSGGMGEVYKAYDLTLNRLVAVKLLAAEMTSDKERKQRFIQEAKTASALNHPNICTIHEIGESDGLDYIVMEYIAGRTLKEAIHSGSLDLRHKIEIAIQAAEGLSKAHDAGIVHRDIKPENIMISGDGYAKIVDFGLAKLTEVRNPGNGEESLDSAERLRMTGTKPASLTTPGVVLGTVGYMSPEQARAKAIDHRSDIFSFGTVLYELFTGRDPFPGASPIEVLHAVLTDAPKPVSSDLPDVLRHIIAKALEKDPDHRYQTMKELVTDLKRLKRDTESSERTLTQAGGVAETVIWPLPTSRTVRLRLALGLGIGALLVLTTVLIGMRFFQSTRSKGDTAPTVIRTLAILPFRLVRPDNSIDFLGFSLADAITTKLAFVQSLVVRPSSSIERYRDKAVDPKQAGVELGADAILAGSLLKEGPKIQITAQLVEVLSNRILWSETFTVPVQDIITLQDKISEEIVKGLRLRLSAVEYERMRRDVPRNSLAYEYYLRALSLGQSSLDRVKLAIDLLEKSVELDSDYAPAWMELGIRYYTIGTSGFGGSVDYEKSDTALKRAIELNNDLPRAHLQLAQNDVERGRTEEALAQLRQLLAINPNSPELHLGMAYVLRYAGLLPESLKEAERIEHIDPKYWQNQPRAVVNTYLYMGRYRKFLESVPPVETAYTLFYRGFAFYHMGEKSRAVEDFARAYQTDPNDVFAKLALALQLALQGDRQKGLEVVRETENQRLTESVPDGEVTYKLAELYSVLGEPESAVRLLEMAIEQGFFAYPYIAKDPLLDGIRGTAGYERVLDIARRRYEAFKTKYFPEAPLDPATSK